MATVKDMLRCPKCGERKLGKSRPQKFGKEYFAHCCHEYFGVDELVNHWGYDAADLYQAKVDLSWVGLCTTYPVDGRVEHTKSLHSEFDDGEPYWKNLDERVEAMELVNRMILGIPELDDYADQMNTYEDALGIGVQ